MAWKWISNNCKQAKFILKLDDDTIPNIFIILDMMYRVYNNIHFNETSCSFSSNLSNTCSKMSPRMFMEMR